MGNSGRDKNQRYSIIAIPENHVGNAGTFYAYDHIRLRGIKCVDLAEARRIIRWARRHNDEARLDQLDWKEDTQRVRSISKSGKVAEGPGESNPRLRSRRRRDSQVGLGTYVKQLVSQKQFEEADTMVML